MNIYQKLQAISKEISYLNKDIKVSSLGKNYLAISEKQIVEALNPLLEKYNIFYYIPQVNPTWETTDVQRGDVRELLRCCNVKMCVCFIDIDSNEMLHVESVGSGVDYGDKASGKAYTYAFKYALLKTFRILFNDDADAFGSVPTYTEMKKGAKQPDYMKASQKQIDWINSLVKQTDTMLDNLLYSYRVRDLKDLSKEDANKIIQELKEEAESRKEDLPF